MSTHERTALLTLGVLMHWLSLGLGSAAAQKSALEKIARKETTLMKSSHGRNAFDTARCTCHRVLRNRQFCHNCTSKAMCTHWYFVHRSSSIVGVIMWSWHVAFTEAWLRTTRCAIRCEWQRVCRLCNDGFQNRHCWPWWAWWIYWSNRR